MKKVIVLSLITLTICLPVGKVFATGTVEINTATLAQLEQLTGVGPVIAQRIIDARPFSSVNDLLKVKGIGEKTLQKIKDQGLAYVGGQVQQTTPTTNQTQVTQTQPESPLAQTITPTTPITYPVGVVVNEIMPSPAGPDETDEWIELYNSNTTAVDLFGWKLQDTQGVSTTYIFPPGTHILGNAYMVLKRPDTNILLNNEGDSLNLLWPNEHITDSASFTNAQKNQSYNNISGNWQWSTTPTPNEKNIITVVAPPKVTPKPSSALSKTIKTDIKANVATASISAPFENYISDNPEKTSTSNPWLLFLIALAVIITSAITILFINFELRNAFARFFSNLRAKR